MGIERVSAVRVVVLRVLQTVGRLVSLWPGEPQAKGCEAKGCEHIFLKSRDCEDVGKAELETFHDKQWEGGWKKET